AGAVGRRRSYGFPAGARTHPRAVLQLSKARDIEFLAAFALALARETGQAREIETDLDKRFPEDTNVRLHYLPVLRGLQALDLGETEEALTALEAASPYEIACNSASFYV